MRDQDQPQEPSGLGPAIRKPAPEPKAEPVKGKPWLFKAPDGKLSTALPDPPVKP